MNVFHSSASQSPFDTFRSWNADVAEGYRSVPAASDIAGFQCPGAQPAINRTRRSPQAHGIFRLIADRSAARINIDVVEFVSLNAGGHQRIGLGSDIPASENHSDGLLAEAVPAMYGLWPTPLT
jgi:hypothetical protein